MLGVGIGWIVAAFNVVGTLLMVVLEKTREVGVLGAMGASGRQVRRAFLEFGALYRERYTTVGLYENAVYDGAPEMMRALSDMGYRLALATAKPIAYAAKITAHFGLAPLMRAEFGSELDGTRTDKRDLLRYCLAETGADPARSFMLGDRMHDARGALANGVTPLGALWGFGSREELEEIGCAAIGEAPSDIPALVEALR